MFNLKILNIAIYRLFRASLRHPKRVVTLAALLVLILGASMSKMRFLLSTDDLIGDGIPSSDQMIELKKNFREGPSTLLVLSPSASRGPLTAEELCQVRRWYSAERLSNDDLVDVQSPYDLREVSSPAEVNRITYPILLDLDCDQVEMATSHLPTQWAKVRASPWAFMMTDQAGRDLSIQFTFRETPDFKFGNFNPKAVQDLRDRFDLNLKSLPGVEHHWVGTADYQHATQIGLQWASRLNFVMLLFLLIAIRLAYGTWKAGFVFNGTIIVSAIIIYGAKGLFHSPFDVLSNSIFLMLGISTLEDFVFVLGDQLEHGSNWRTSLRRVILPGFYTSMTTMIGFLSLCTSHLRVIQRLGLWSAVGALVEWLMIFLVIPSLFVLLKQKSSWVDPKKAYFAQFVRGWSKKRISPVLARVSLMVYPLAIASAFFLNVNDSSHFLFPASHPLRVGLRHILESRNWLGSVNLVFSSELSPEKKESILTEFLKEPTAKAHVTHLETNPITFQYLTQSIPVDRKEAVLNDFKDSKIYSRLVAENGQERAILYLNLADVDTVTSLQSELKKHCSDSECNLVGSLVSYAEFSSLIPKTLLESMLLSLVLVSLVIFLLAHHLNMIKETIPLLLASFWGPVLMLALEGVFQLKVNFLTCIFASVLVGLTGDNAIQFLFSSRRASLEEGVKKRGGASIITTLLMASASFVFLGSYFDPPKKFGALLAGGLLASLIGDLWILKGLRQKQVSVRTE